MSGTHAHTVAYVRETMLPEQDPPLTEAGAIKWMRENLFSGWLNNILTILSIFVIYSVLSHIVPWFYNSIWNAGSLSECREIRDATIGSDASSACFAVISDRWQQLLFGFYASEAYWRPVLALVLFLVAMGPILFESVPRKLLWYTAASPFILFWLLWGGSIWGPIAVAAGFAVGWGAFVGVSLFAGTLLAVIAAILVPILYWMFLAGPIAGGLHSIIPIGITFIESDDFGGFMLSFIIGISGIILSLPLGILLALGRQSDMFIINKVSVAFIEVIRGVPLIVWLFTASLLLNYFLPPGTNFDLMLRVIIMVTLFSAAYIAEVVRGGLAALPKGQYEAADALGLDYWKSMRLIVLPQALKISIPGIVNTFIGLFKDTTLVVFIGLLDPIGLSGAIRASTDWNGIYWELFVFIGLLFFVCCFSMGQYSIFLERKLRREHR
ncbi:MAG: amino acid ABC transporter permease [Rhodobacteraceae bacterium]|nr:amino acid ABC transporter permease [Paracoccaceae bacterium]